MNFQDRNLAVLERSVLDGDISNTAYCRKLNSHASPSGEKSKDAAYFYSFTLDYGKWEWRLGHLFRKSTVR